MALYTLQGQVGLKRYGLHNVQIVCLIILAIQWILFLLFWPNAS
jgi:hypothetical protein